MPSVDGNSFTDLAEIVSRIPQVTPNQDEKMVDHYQLKIVAKDRNLRKNLNKLSLRMVCAYY